MSLVAPMLMYLLAASVVAVTPVPLALPIDVQELLTLLLVLPDV